MLAGSVAFLTSPTRRTNGRQAYMIRLSIFLFVVYAVMVFEPPQPRPVSPDVLANRRAHAAEIVCWDRSGTMVCRTRADWGRGG